MRSTVLPLGPLRFRPPLSTAVMMLVFAEMACWAVSCGTRRFKKPAVL